MKLYVNPVSYACPAKCKFCITKYRREGRGNEMLKVAKLREALCGKHFEKIEITGGGEPTLHPKIGEIIKICAKHAPTIMYTNGNQKPTYELRLLSELCISRVHHNDAQNRRIMGISYKMDGLRSIGVPIKLSLMVHQSGIADPKKLFEYLTWAEKFADKVVVRQLFEHAEQSYLDYYKKEYVSTEDLAKKMHIKTDSFRPDENIFFHYGEMSVELERRSCACENTNPVLYANGELKDGWA
jgi:molybdenum cofactor biosynthesis enzyme MoaA